MVIYKQTEIDKIKAKLINIPNEYRKSFDIDGTNKLYCKNCFVTFSNFKNHNIKRRINSDGHKQKTELLEKINDSNNIHQTNLKYNIDDIKIKIFKCFLENDISLFKLRNKSLKELFMDLGQSLSSESHMRGSVLNIVCDDLIIAIKNKLVDKQVFLIIDESYNNNKYIVNILMGDMELSNKLYITHSEIFEKHTNSTQLNKTI